MNNKLGIYYAFWEQAWQADYLKYVHKAARLGFDVLELAAGSLPEMTSAQRRDISSAARDAEIELTYCIGMPLQYDMAAEDVAVRRAGMDHACTLLHCIHEMGGDMLGGIIYSCWPAKMDFHILDKSAWWDRSAACVREVAKCAEDLGIDYCLEIVNRFEQFLLNTAEEGVRFCDDVGSPRVKLLLDSFHMNIEEDSFGEAIRTAGRRIGHFHIGETNRRVPGRGRMPWGEIVEALQAVDYQGRIVMEPFLKMGGQVGEDIKVWRDLSCGGDEAFMDNEARFALAFMRERLLERG